MREDPYVPERTHFSENGRDSLIGTSLTSVLQHRSEKVASGEPEASIILRNVGPVVKNTASSSINYPGPCKFLFCKKSHVLRQKNSMGELVWYVGDPTRYFRVSEIR